MQLLSKLQCHCARYCDQEIFHSENRGKQLTVPSLTYPPEALVIGRAVRAVRGVLIACSMVLGRPLCVLGLTNPVIGLPN